MAENLKIIIADDEIFICNMLKILINFDELGLELIGTASDGEKLLELIESKQPDIVLTDICMPKLDEFEIIQKVKLKGILCRFIILSGHRQFESTYNSLKYDVKDFLLKPIDVNELSTTLKKISDEIRQANLNHLTIENNIASRNYYISKGIEELIKNSLTLDEINRTYGTNFCEGLFQMIFFKLDYSNGVKNINEDASSLIKKLKVLIKKQFCKYYADIIYEDKFDGVMALLNYPLQDEKSVKDGIYDLYFQVKNLTNLLNSTNLTLCVSGVVQNPCTVWHTKEQVRDAAWSRMAGKINRVIFYQELENKNTYLTQDTLEELKNRLINAFEILDIVAFQKCMDEFFALPITVLCSYDARIFVCQVRDLFFEMNEELISSYTNAKNLYYQVAHQLHLCTTFRQYKDVFKEKLSNILERISEEVKKQNIKPIRQAYTFIHRNYGRPITLEDVAKEVNLSRVYFSNLFKKETGKHFTEYVVEYKMKVARGLLKKSDLNISQIASSLSFYDVRYFSKVFKKTVGVTPTDYRKIHN